MRVGILIALARIAFLVCPRSLGMASKPMDENDACWSAESEKGNMNMVGSLLERRLLWFYDD
jgi:hypothetical protein